MDMQSDCKFMNRGTPKSGSTVDASFFAGTEAFGTRLPKGSSIVRRLVYVTPWAKIQDQRW